MTADPFEVPCFFANLHRFMSSDLHSNNDQPVAAAPDFEKAEIDLLRENLRRSHKERFLMATHLYKVQQTMKKAVITHKPYISK